MELLSPEAIDHVGITIGGIGLVVFIRAVYAVGRMGQAFISTMDEIKKTMKSHRDHIKTEDKHHERVADLLGRIEVNGRVGQPRPVSGDHTPIPVSVPPGE